MENTAKQYQEETISAVCTALGEALSALSASAVKMPLLPGRQFLRQPPAENWLIIL